MSLIKGLRSGGHATVRVQKPSARSAELVVEEVGDELLIYDRTNQRAHSLGATAARVWRACDGQTDVQTLAENLDLAPETVTRALDELRDSELLDEGLQLLDGGNGGGASDDDGITRRSFTRRSATIGSAAFAAPLVYTIAVNTPIAAATPTPFQCEVFTTQDCGASSGCGAIAGCCCCCQGGGNCKTCGATKFCNAGTQPCSPVQGGGFGAKCSDTAGTNPADPRGCCSVNGAKQCGCGFGPSAGCCNQNTGAACTPSSTDTNCFPCCNNVPLTSASPLGCCTSPTVNCCAASPPACCAKSTVNNDCCKANPPACCSGPVGTCT